MMGGIEDATLYYVQRNPKELGNISWAVDRKDRSLTKMEEIWSTLILPISESHVARRPMVALKGADYSHFNQRYAVPPDDENMVQHVKWMRETYGIEDRGGDLGLNSNRLFSEQLVFADSKDSLGLQMADILASTLRRACNRQLKLSGWSEFGRLLVRKNAKTSRFISFSQRSTELTDYLEKVWRELDSISKPMIVEQ